MKKNQTYKITKRKVVFSKGPVHLVDCQVKMPDGKVLSRQILEHPGAVVILPRISKDKFILIRQFRFATGTWIWEFPAGGVETGETRKSAARRELIEEVGQKPKKLREIIKFYPTPGVSQEMMYLYLAEGLSPATLPQDEDEDIEVHEFTLQEIGRMIDQGTIVDGKTILGYYCLKKELANP